MASNNNRHSDDAFPQGVKERFKKTLFALLDENGPGRAFLIHSYVVMVYENRQRFSASAIPGASTARARAQTESHNSSLYNSRPLQAGGRYRSYTEYLGAPAGVMPFSIPNPLYMGAQPTWRGSPSSQAPPMASSHPGGSGKQAPGQQGGNEATGAPPAHA
ncbi:uncharacterized protein B0I36DRAFT_350615 [Microdochium trichocladiopsis]|uniref:Uncharacterized protein n=1 Tax=Microdochium trichocladiopsis TaxID=1682393 RepID=A0A9P8Y511_9PEZI|nr:uncharacterized protein B0I36DRAFT_350615 [Microdochium trichocladiopsis]KAH7029806.1 hypothetical protein B0I36DRAFT_350615 [Microdochium trichocladiopsis]